MNKVIFVILALIISTDIIPVVLFGLLGAMIFWTEGTEPYLTLYMLLIVFINLIFKISIFPIIFEIQKKYKMKSISFFEKLEKDKKSKNELLIISIILDFIILILNISIFEELGIMTYLLIGGGVLLSYCSLLAWLKLSKSKFKTLSVNLFKSIIIIGLLLFVYAGVSIFNSLKDRDIRVSEYHKMLKELRTDYGSERLSFFPKSIPQNAEGYYFRIEESFDGYDTHYVKFDKDKTYIDNVLKEYKGKCEILTTKDKIDSYNIRFYIDELKKADRICVLHKSKPEKRYTSGISVYDKTNTIYFFYANF